MMWLRNILRGVRTFQAHSGGLSALEFGIVAPVLVAGLLTCIDVATIISRSSDMQAAARAGTQYLMNGGTDTAAASTLVSQSWSGKPSSGTVTVNAVCKCGTTVASCTTTCSAGVTLSKTFTVSLSQSVSGFLITNWPTRVSETVQTQ